MIASRIARPLQIRSRSTGAGNDGDFFALFTGVFYYNRRVGWLSSLLRGGSDELGWDDLVRNVIDAIAAHRRYGPRGEAAFPPHVVVRITVREETTAIVQ